MQTTQRHLSEIMSPKGLVSATAMPDLKLLVERYPYFHLARLSLLRLLYQQRDPAFNDELRKAAIYLPSRETIFNFVEANRMKPVREGLTPAGFSGAILSRKPNEHLNRGVEDDDNRTTSLIDSFLNSIPNNVETTQGRQPVPQRRGRADASVDYISYMLQEEADNNAAMPAIETTVNTDTPAVTENKDSQQTVAPEASVADNPKQDADDSKQPSNTGTTELIDKFIEKQGDRRIRLKEKNDSDLQKPVLDVDNGQQKGAFTETLARIYIKQGKFEQAIEIIRRLSLKYPKKNRYFADQIRFLEKIIANNKVAKAAGQGKNNA